MDRETKGVAACGALALGEAVGIWAEGWAAIWPLVALALALTVLFGFGGRLRGWGLLAVALGGLLLAFVHQASAEARYRERFWLRAHEKREAAREPAPVWRPLVGVKRELARRAGLGLAHAPDLAGLNRAILLGEREHLPGWLRQVFVESGTVHVFAISGLHVMLVAQVFAYLLLLMGFPCRLIGVVTIPLLWAYVLMIGCPPSAARAALMASFYFSAPLFCRRPNGVMSWVLAFLVIHVLSPRQIADVGSLLSFAVMLGIVLWCRYSRRFERKWIAGLGVSLVAWAMGVPIAAHVFGRVTPGGLLANMALIPAAFVTVASGVVGLAVSFVSETLAAHLNNLSALFTWTMVGVSHVVSRLPGANFAVGSWPLWECAAWYAALALGWLLVHLVWLRRHRF